MAKSKIASTVLPAVLAAGAAAEDPWLWLEDVSGEAPLAWVGERNALTVEGYAQGAAFAAARDRFKAILDSDDRIPYVSKHGDAWYNFWRDERNPRGIWRRTTLEEYRKESPAWEVVLDVDALAEAEGENWVFKGAEYRRPDFRRCLVMLSRGGADAVVVREFDLVEKAFVEDGFFLPEAKSGVDWAGPDRLFVGTDFGPGSMTESGYPRIAKVWERGTPLADATVLFEGAVEDVSVSAWADLGEYPREFVGRAIDFWNRETYLYRDGETVRIDAPTSANVSVFRERLFIRLTQDWTVGGEVYAAGSFLAADLEEFLGGNRTLETLFAPTPTVSLESVSLTRNHVILTLLDNVVYRLVVLTPGPEGWRRAAMPAGDGYDSAYAEAVDRETSDAYFLHINGYLTPPTLAYGELGPAGGGADRARVLKTTPALFDAAGLEVTQHFTDSADGTRVPYFQVRPAGSDGPGPTLLYGYGGFEISMTPGYQALTGAGWLEAGGTYVVANIRGGGEFGPSWHRAALKENRPLAFQDFAAVAEDLLRREVTTPRQLGIMGGSNGGLLMGNMLTWRPELFGAVVAQVPLFDMRRYHELLAGASWMAEYGDPDVPEEWAFIRGFSPYHNVGPGADYPPVLVTTSTRDDRVHPGHARKMVAKLTAMGHGVDYYENVEGGHAGAADNAQSAFMWALAYGFLWRHLGGEHGKSAE
ncbi:MAG: prolyl oligopeptidase family serine peptidase [Gammaproteobacteria bacterium]|nr:prolyl oligopeptidase family serine peptidase [Gammaproteobacteria bacterium]